jgi:hypothetical protein
MSFVGARVTPKSPVWGHSKSATITVTLFVGGSAMRVLIIGAVVLLIAAMGGLLYAKASVDPGVESTAGFICPLTGEELPCPKCCPLNQP